MYKAAVLMSLGLMVNSSAAVAAAPVFQLKARGGAPLSAVDSYPVPSRLQQHDTLPGARAAGITTVAEAASDDVVLSNAADDAAADDGPRLMPIGIAEADTIRDGTGLMTAGYDTGSARYADIGADAASTGLSTQARMNGVGATSRMSGASKDSLYYFLKNFKARPVQQPAHWTMFLVGLCFVLYQVRRRPMRASIGFNTAAKLIGGRNAGNGLSMGMGNHRGLNAGAAAHAVSA